MKDRYRASFWCVYLTLGGLVWVPAALAQSNALSTLENHTLRVDVNLVTFNFSATDRYHRNIENLEREDIVIYEDEMTQQIVSFDSEPMPLSLVVLVDVSESTGPYLKQIETTSRFLSDLLSEQDDAAVIAFSNLPNLLQEFTRDKAKIRSALHQARRSFTGATNINDSIYLAARKLGSTPADKRKVILLISDGKGNRGEQERALAQLRSCGATLLGIGVGVTATLYRGSLVMGRWIRETGGEYLSSTPEKELRKNLEKALSTVRRQYSAAYVPANKLRDGRFRRLRIEISQHSALASKRITIQGPEGYFAPSDAAQHP
jgi:Ca-activated chloride channel homolog